MSYTRSLPMYMLPNDSHPGRGCSCEHCVRMYPDLPQHHPDWGTPNYCAVCSPKGYMSCHCEIASNN